MSVEIVNYLGDLQPHLPGELDLVSEGDEHILNIKKAYKASFPNFNSELKYSNDELNGIRSFISGNSNKMLWNGNWPSSFSNPIFSHKADGEIVLSNDILPIGSIVPSWFSNDAFMNLYKYGPSSEDFNFNLCNGDSITGTKLNLIMGIDPYILPDLRNRYLRQTKNEANIGTKEEDTLNVVSWTFPSIVVPKNVFTLTTNGSDHEHSTGSPAGGWTQAYDCAASWGSYNADRWSSPSGGMATLFNFGGLTVKNNAWCGSALMIATRTYKEISYGNHRHAFTPAILNTTTLITQNGTTTRPLSKAYNFFIRVD